MLPPNAELHKLYNEHLVSFISNTLHVQHNAQSSVNKLPTYSPSHTSKARGVMMFKIGNMVTIGTIRYLYNPTAFLKSITDILSIVSKQITQLDPWKYIMNNMMFSISCL